MSTASAKSAPPENVLYRSRIEICRILQDIAKSHSSLFAELDGGRTFVSRILFVDPRAGYFVVSYCANKSLNSKLLKTPSLKFTANYRDAHLIFEVANPGETRFDGQSAIQFALPNTLILYRRRESPRIPIPAEASLRCIADATGFVPFESHITDISHDGLGGIIYDRGIKLEPGSVLTACRIIIPGSKAIVADLLLRHISLTVLADGTLAHRAGFRLLQRPDELPELINFFAQNLDKE
ncbi:MAG: flagellar brake protein [Gallionellaceae bacterium]|nr:MAG: flagellar brake protein [Gallionellaceae bacterium]